MELIFNYYKWGFTIWYNHNHMPSAHGLIFVYDEWKSVRVCRLFNLLLRYKIAPMISRSCLRPKISLCALTSSNNGTSPAIVTHNSSEESDKKSVRVRWLLVREKVGPIISRNCMWQKIGRLCWLCFTPTFSRISLRQKIGPCALGNRQQSS